MMDSYLGIGHLCPRYISDLAPCGFFPKITSVLKRIHFETIDAMKTTVTEVMRKLPKNNLQHCFQIVENSHGVM